MFGSKYDRFCCVYPAVVFNVRPEGGDAASWSPPHLLGSAKQWEYSGFCAVSERHVDQPEGKFKNQSFKHHCVSFILFFVGCLLDFYKNI